MSLNDVADFSLSELLEATTEEASPYLVNAAMGMLLITRLIAHPPAGVARSQEQHLNRLHQLIHQGFVSLSARDDFPAEAQAYRDLLALEESLEELVFFPELANKTVVGVGGGFSAGKSRFLNTLVGKVRLPESTEPTTAIPTFLTGGSEEIVALNAFNNLVPIDADALHAISHSFQQHFRNEMAEGVGFAHVLKLLLLRRPDFPWEHLAFLDTPGYSKSDGRGVTNTDEVMAQKQLAQADHVLWLMNAKNGSLQRSDLEFLRTLNHPKPVFFVITQADLVGASRVRAILGSTARAVERAGIDCAGLMAWAAPLDVDRGKRLAGDDIGEWLAQLDGAPKRTTKRVDCARIFDAYILHNSNALASNRETLSTLNEVRVLAQSLGERRQAILQAEIQRLRNDQRRLKSLVEDFTALRDEMLDVITDIVGRVAEDEAVRRGHELIYLCRREWLSRAVAAGDRLEVRVLARKSDTRKVVVAVGDDVARLGLPYSIIRGGLRIDPEGLVKGSLLAAEVRGLDEQHVTFVITNPHGME